MNFSFDASKTQQPNAFPPRPAGGIQGLAGGQTGAGDAGKTLSQGFALPSMQSQPKPGLFGSNLGASTAPTFGSSAPSTAGVSSLNSNVGAPTSSAPGLTFGSSSTPAMGLNFSMGNVSSTPSTGFAGSGFAVGGLGTANATSTPVGLSFAVPKPSATPATAAAFSLGTPGTASAPATASTTPKLTFGVAAATTPASSGFSLGGNVAAAPIGAPATTAASFSLATPAATSGQQTGISLGSSTASAGFNLAPGTATQPLSFGVPQTTGTTAATTPSTGFPSQGTTASSLTTAFNLGTSVAPAISSGFSLNKTTTTQASASAATVAPTATTSAPQTTLGTVTTVSSAGTGQVGTMNFCQLEESINKWTLELEEQEKAFVNQATQVNSWDKLLIANGEKIATLNQEVERVKLEQQHLEHELDYVVGQQKELQDCLVPLEKELASLSVADPERDYTYRLAENLDKQLKTMSQDLKEIIEHLNEANRSQDSSDPIVQIGKILNAHMNSLQWLDQRTSVLGQKIQQIDQMHQNFRQENERSFSLAYN